MSPIQENLTDRMQTAADKPECDLGLAADFTSQFATKDGIEVSLRPIRPDDEPLMAQFHQTLSDRSVYMRYFCSLSLRSRVAHERLIRICHVDGDREDRATGQHEILGVGRLIIESPKDEAEVAIVISDQYQKQGLGTELLRRTLQIARDKKVRRVWGELLRDNLAMQVIVRKMGFRLGLCSDAASITAVLEM